jgi:hypothetical protein
VILPEDVPQFPDDYDPKVEWPEGKVDRLMAIMPQVKAYRAELEKKEKEASS